MIRRLSKLASLPGAERRALVWAAGLLTATAAGLRILPFATLRAVVNRVAQARTKPHPDRCPAEVIAWALSRGGRVAPGGRNCLVQALAGQVLLAWHGHPAELCLGVAHDSAGEILAHAWVESGGTAVIGKSRGAGYTLLGAL